MSRYIDADLLLAQCRRNPLFEKTEEDKRMIYIERSIIDATPTADVVEVRHGEWIDKHCSVCGETQPYTARGNAFAMTFYQFKTKFCPECGAYMRGENDGKE